MKKKKKRKYFKDRTLDFATYACINSMEEIINELIIRVAFSVFFIDFV
jgi:hypothetical protein